MGHAKEIKKLNEKIDLYILQYNGVIKHLIKEDFLLQDRIIKLEKAVPKNVSSWIAAPNLKLTELKKEIKIRQEEHNNFKVGELCEFSNTADFSIVTTGTFLGYMAGAEKPYLMTQLKFNAESLSTQHNFLGHFMKYARTEKPIIDKIEIAARNIKINSALDSILEDVYITKKSLQILSVGYTSGIIKIYVNYFDSDIIKLFTENNIKFVDLKQNDTKYYTLYKHIATFQVI